jgi:hypothetical protein
MKGRDAIDLLLDKLDEARAKAPAGILPETPDIDIIAHSQEDLVAILRECLSGWTEPEIPSDLPLRLFGMRVEFNVFVAPGTLRVQERTAARMDAWLG